MGVKLIIDLDKCRPQGQSGARCSYRHHPNNAGIDSLLEMIRFSLICRRCEAAPCVNACPRGALEKLPGENNDAGTLKRANMLCTGCGTCSIACPFGTVYSDLVPFPSSVCDRCDGRLHKEEKPLCVTTSEDRAIEYADAEPGDGLVEVFEGVLVRVGEAGTWDPFLRNREKARK